MLASLLASSSELSLHCPCDEYQTYCKSITEELEMTRRNLQSEDAQCKEVSGDQKSKPTGTYAQEASEATNEQKREIAFYKVLGSTFYSLCRYKTSIWYYERAAEMIKATGEKSEEHRIYTSLAVVHIAVGQFNEAVSLQEKALQLSWDTGDLRGELECYNILGSLHNARGQHDLAIDYYLRGLNGHDRMASAMAHNNLGNVYHALGQYLKAIDHHEESLRIRNEIDDNMGRSITYNNLSCDFYLLGKYETAILYQEEALKISESMGIKKHVAVCYSNLGCLNEALGKHQMSLENHYNSLKIRTEIGDCVGEQRCYIEIKRVHDSLGRLRDAIKYHEKALKLERMINNKHENAVTHAPHGQWIAHQERGLEIIEEIGVRDIRRLILYKMALSHTSKLDVLKASRHLAEKIRSHECIRLPLSEEYKFSLDEQSVPFYKTLALMLVSLEHYTDALLVLEQGRARALVDLVSRKYGIHEVTSQTYDEHFRIIRSFFATQRENVLFMATLMDSICLWFIDRLGNVLFKSYFVNKDVMHESLLNFVCSGCRGKGGTFAMAWQTPPPTERADNEEALNSFLQYLTYPCEKARRMNVPFVHQVIFGVADDLPDDEEIIFVPEGAMFQLPFPALQNANRDYLAEKVRIRLVPSITTLKLIQDSPADYHSKTGALLVGDPCTPRIIRQGQNVTELARLPGARHEVEMIARLLGDRESCLTGSNATKQEVLRRIQNVSLVHISAHGKMETGEIALAGEESSSPEDWLLTMEDVSNVGIRAKLVVLSTCHSACGKIMTAEGIVCMARAFLGCGARSVLVALWAIDDQATLVFMTSFYKFLFVHKMSASRALQHAMKEMRDSTEYNHVRHWAPFVLYGDDVTLDVNEIRA